MKKVLFMIAMTVSMTQMSAQTEGGKYFEPKSEFNDKPFVFSNRGETEAILKLNAAYNKMDAKACLSLTTEKVKYTDFEGNKMVMTQQDWEGFFAQHQSVNWVIKSIVPIRIKDSDPSSGVIVMGTETRVSKDGKVWKKELTELFMFDLNMKINSLTQFAQGIK